MFKTTFLSSLLFLISVLLLGACRQERASEKPSENLPKYPNEFVLPTLPESIEFCGDKIELLNFDIKERLDKELIVNTFYHSSTIQSIKRANRYFAQISEVLAANNIPDDFKYLCLIESGLTQAVSPSGAKGFWQFMPQTAKEFGLTINSEIDERLDIEKSTKAACEYLNRANERFNDWVLSAASYNRGVGGIESDLEDQGVSSYFDLYLNEETSRYVFRILALKIIFENQEKYGFNSEKLELYEKIKTRELEVNESITDLKAWSKSKGSNYRMLRICNPWVLGNTLTISSNSNYIIHLPL